MASPMMPQTPTPRPPHRSIAGPVVLIVMGILFLMGTMGIMDIHHLGSLFARFWPALLILWGALKLIEYEQAKRYGQPVRGIGVGGVFLMLFLIVSGLIATQAARVDWKNLGEHIQLGDDEGIDEIFGGSSFDYSGELSNALPAAGNSLHVDSLHINDDHGTITVNVSEDKKVKVSWRKKVHAENQQDADRYNAKTDPSITQGDKVLTLNANTQGAGDKGVTTDLDIYVPVNTALVIASGRGAVTIAGMAGNVEVDHHRGEVNINDHTGNVSLDMESGSVRLGHVKGDVTVQGKGERSGGGRCGWRGAREWRVSGNSAGSSQQDGEFPLGAHGHGIFAPGWQDGSGFWRPARRFAERTDAAEDPLEGHNARRLLGRPALGRRKRDGLGWAVQAGEYPDRQPPGRRAGFDSAEYGDQS